MYLLDGIANKREFLARSLGIAGVTRLLEQFNSRRRALVVVLTYHRIAEPGMRSNPFYDPVISATPESFEKQMTLLREHFLPISITEMRDQDALCLAASRARKPPLLVTFDDGYRDNFEAALPILQKLGIPAIVFIPTRFLDRPELPWWDHVAYVLKRTESEQLFLGRYRGDPEPLKIGLGHDAEDPLRIAAIKLIIDLFLQNMIPDESWFLAELEAQAGVPVSSPALGRELFMDWDQLRKLAGTGLSVGSHGHSHMVLARLDDQAQMNDLRDSKQMLEANLGNEVIAVAYPFGRPGTFNIRTQRLAAEAGYQFGFSSIEGVNRPGSAQFEPLCLRRLNVGTGDSGLLLRTRAMLHGAFGKSLL